MRALKHIRMKPSMLRTSQSSFFLTNHLLLPGYSVRYFSGKGPGVKEPTEEDFIKVVQEAGEDPATISAEQKKEIMDMMYQSNRHEYWSKYGRESPIPGIYLPPDLPEPGEEEYEPDELKFRAKTTPPKRRQSAKEIPDLDDINSEENQLELEEIMKKNKEINQMFKLSLGIFLLSIFGMIVVPRIYRGKQKVRDEYEPELMTRTAYVPSPIRPSIPNS